MSVQQRNLNFPPRRERTTNDVTRSVIEFHFNFETQFGTPAQWMEQALVPNSYLDFIFLEVASNVLNRRIRLLHVHYATILKTFGIEEIREILCTLQAHYVFCMHLWDVIIHI